ncbi:hypothetical protein FKP32DRAFT_651367 [Trametes sanguinea]|nr:hypothetical protein FKP32DRAFT_651367 [Trametes sanguinea]
MAAVTQDRPCVACDRFVPVAVAAVRKGIPMTSGGFTPRGRMHICPRRPSSWTSTPYTATAVIATAAPHGTSSNTEHRVFQASVSSGYRAAKNAQGFYVNALSPSRPNCTLSFAHSNVARSAPSSSPDPAPVAL